MSSESVSQASRDESTYSILNNGDFERRALSAAEEEAMLDAILAAQSSAQQPPSIFKSITTQLGRILGSISDFLGIILGPFYRFLNELSDLIGFSNLLVIFALFSMQAGRQAMGMWAMFLFPLVFLVDFALAKLAYDQAKAAGFKNASLNRRSALEAITALTMGVVVVLFLGGMPLSGMVVPIMFACVMGFKTLDHFISFFFEIFQAVKDDETRKKQHLAKALQHLITFVSISLLTVGTILALAVGFTNLTYLAVIGAGLGLSYAVARRVFIMPTLAETDLNSPVLLPLFIDDEEEIAQQVEIDLSELDLLQPIPAPPKRTMLVAALGMAIIGTALVVLLKVGPGSIFLPCLFSVTALLEIFAVFRAYIQAKGEENPRFENASLNRKAIIEIVSALTISAAMVIAWCGLSSGVLALAAPIMFIVVLGFRTVNALIDVGTAWHNIDGAPNYGVAKDIVKKEAIAQGANFLILGAMVMAVIGLAILHIELLVVTGIISAAVLGALYMGHMAYGATNSNSGAQPGSVTVGTPLHNGGGIPYASPSPSFIRSDTSTFNSPERDRSMNFRETYSGTGNSFLRPRVSRQLSFSQPINHDYNIPQ